MEPMDLNSSTNCSQQNVDKEVKLFDGGCHLSTEKQSSLKLSNNGKNITDDDFLNKLIRCNSLLPKIESEIVFIVRAIDSAADAAISEIYILGNFIDENEVDHLENEGDDNLESKGDDNLESEGDDNLESEGDDNLENESDNNLENESDDNLKNESNGNLENKGDDNLQIEVDDNLEIQCDDNLESKGDGNLENECDHNLESKGDGNLENQADGNLENQGGGKLENEDDDNLQSEDDDNLESEDDDNFEHEGDDNLENEEDGFDFDDEIDGNYMEEDVSDQHQSSVDSEDSSTESSGIEANNSSSGVDSDDCPLESENSDDAVGESVEKDEDIADESDSDGQDEEMEISYDEDDNSNSEELVSESGNTDCENSDESVTHGETEESDNDSGNADSNSGGSEDDCEQSSDDLSTELEDDDRDGPDGYDRIYYTSYLHEKKNVLEDYVLGLLLVREELFNNTKKVEQESLPPTSTEPQKRVYLPELPATSEIEEEEVDVVNENDTTSEVESKTNKFFEFVKQFQSFSGQALKDFIKLRNESILFVRLFSNSLKPNLNVDSLIKTVNQHIICSSKKNNEACGNCRRFVNNPTDIPKIKRKPKGPKNKYKARGNYRRFVNNPTDILKLKRKLKARPQKANEKITTWIDVDSESDDDTDLQGRAVVLLKELSEVADKKVDICNEMITCLLWKKEKKDIDQKLQTATKELCVCYKKLKAIDPKGKNTRHYQLLVKNIRLEIHKAIKEYQDVSKMHQKLLYKRRAKILNKDNLKEFRLLLKKIAPGYKI